MSVEDLDILIVGAGLSGIGAACHLRRECPDKRLAILEGRAAMGGTWDLFRYPGIRSDSDMYTLGYSFRPWTDPQTIADGPSIRRYIEDTAREHDVDALIRYQHRVQRAQWDSEQALWTLEVQRGDAAEPLQLRCRMLMLCTGYYRYEAGYTPDFPGREQFAGTFIHPQLWPQDFDPSGKRILVIGSGATAVTLVPALADQAASVTMLQRSPSYVINLPQHDRLLAALRRWLPSNWVYRLGRTRNVAFQMLFYRLAKSCPGMIRRLLLGLARRQLGEGYDMRHFSPRYNPWDQRVCAVPDGDLFAALRQGRAEVVTDEIETFTEAGVKLRSGRELPADAIVSATGLELQLFGGMQLVVDGRPFVAAESMGYRGLMLRDLPNAAVILGYTNASWTLKADLSSQYLCRVIRHMDALGMRQVTPRQHGEIGKEPFLDLQSGYIDRAAHLLPSQGDRMPWKLYQNYLLDLALLRHGRLDDGCLEFSSPQPTQDDELALSN
ncbi:flavin-containing monooxygenase [Pseudomonas sp. Gutcm_11s]|uniref:flavin-containing monooxygenase n=1 Tax=Pseudomonas sp. Gutcm_11s TaxID=3026088 RepID=UPI0023629815|nr:NAD(P)/FAD-dependent oxidoreductase [Pseudomonas sp. Gutcm_11s]MDD0841511.1 NAD(P)/FAD-dependent oxidoreductase [Pseudomonas sp. Gutcm_11s]